MNPLGPNDRDYQKAMALVWVFVGIVLILVINWILNLALP